MADRVAAVVLSAIALVGCFVFSEFASGVLILVASAYVARRAISLNRSGRSERAMVQLAMAMIPATCALGLICPTAIGVVAWILLFAGSVM